MKQTSLPRMLFTGSVLASALQGSWGTVDCARDKTPFSGRQARAGISCRCCCQVPVALWGLVGQSVWEGQGLPLPTPPPSVCLPHTETSLCLQRTFFFFHCSGNVHVQTHTLMNPHTHRCAHLHM